MFITMNEVEKLIRLSADERLKISSLGNKIDSLMLVNIRSHENMIKKLAESLNNNSFQMKYTRLLISIIHYGLDKEHEITNKSLADDLLDPKTLNEFNTKNLKLYK